MLLMAGVVLIDADFYTKEFDGNESIDGDRRWQIGRRINSSSWAIRV